jgi:hypothetical protein
LFALSLLKQPGNGTAFTAVTLLRASRRLDDLRRASKNIITAWSPGTCLEFLKGIPSIQGFKTSPEIPVSNLNRILNSGTSIADSLFAVKKYRSMKARGGSCLWQESSLKRDLQGGEQKNLLCGKKDQQRKSKSGLVQDGYVVMPQCLMGNCEVMVISSRVVSGGPCRSSILFYFRDSPASCSFGYCVELLS